MCTTNDRSGSVRAVSTIDLEAVPADERAQPDFEEKVARFQTMTRTMFGQFDRIGARETGELFALNPRAEVRAVSGPGADGAIASRQFPPFVGSMFSTVLNA
ncbi:MAG: hypothetical protein HOQ05_13980 [Corynebacteriales bacterium]|nr:hypothetical protein [Mycobacteriales bacterium]